jgi:hypothetical protein
MITPPAARFSGLGALDVTALRRPSERAKPAQAGSRRLTSRFRPQDGPKRRRA